MLALFIQKQDITEKHNCKYHADHPGVWPGKFLHKKTRDIVSLAYSFDV